MAKKQNHVNEAVQTISDKTQEIYPGGMPPKTKLIFVDFLERMASDVLKKRPDLKKEFEETRNSLHQKIATAAA
jgi:hypothetical protein